MSNLLISEPPLTVLPSLAERIGLDEAIVLQQVHYLASSSERVENTKAFKEGFYWVFHTIESWRVKFFRWWSVPTVKRVFQTLTSSGLLLTDTFDAGQGHRRLWYRVNYALVEAIAKISADKWDVKRDNRIKMIQSFLSDQNDPIPEDQVDPIAMDQLDPDTIYKSSNKQEFLVNKTLPPTPQGGESERGFGFEIPQEEPTPNTHTLLTSQTETSHQVADTLIMVSVPPVPIAPQKIKYDPALGMRPPRQRAKFKYPDGPWLNEIGQMRAEFIRDRANLWRTGDTATSKAFGAMAIEDVESYVCSHYMKPENHAKLESDWNAFVSKNQRYVGNVQQRLAAGINISETEQQKILAIAPSLVAESVEPAYGGSEQQSIALPPPKQVLQLESVPDEIWDKAASEMQELESREIVPEGAESVEAYKVLNREDEARHWANFYTSRQQTQSTPVPAQAPADIKKQIEELRLKKSVPSYTPTQRKEQTKLEHWNRLMQTGMSKVIEDVTRQAIAQGYLVENGQVIEPEF